MACFRLDHYCDDKCFRMHAQDFTFIVNQALLEKVEEIVVDVILHL